VAATDEIRHDPAHPGWNHRARKSKKDSDVIGEHLSNDLNSCVEVGRTDARLTVLVDQLGDRHSSTHVGVANRVVMELLSM
jgi:hypothetical protein